MQFSILTLFPNLFDPFLETSLIAKAVEAKHLDFSVLNLFDFVEPKKRIDAPIIGHGSGMAIKPEFIEKAIDFQDTKFGKSYKIFFSPQGKKLNQDLLKNLSDKLKSDSHIMLVNARYEGFDTRVEEHYADLVLSIGDFVLMGGDLPSMVFLEAFTRLVPGVVGAKESIEEESFTGPFLDYPCYTEPKVWKGKEVPEILYSGNHKKISEFRENEAAKKTVHNNFSWLRQHVKEKHDIDLAKKFIPRHYAILMHSNVLLPADQIGEPPKIGTSSVTSLDIHDIARSARTYDLENYFLVTPLEDQKKIVERLLNFWKTDIGIEYNPHRHEAVSHVEVVNDIEAVIDFIRKKENKEPILIATHALDVQENIQKTITYYDQEMVWALDRPVVFLFGTAKGMCSELIAKCDYVLQPLIGFSDFNHLSVRSAAAIIFDRWLGINTVNIKKNL